MASTLEFSFNVDMIPGSAGLYPKAPRGGLASEINEHEHSICTF
jgi:hypothetical protein